MRGREGLVSMYIWAKSLPVVCKSLSDQVLRELLQRGIELNHYDFDLFQEYLNNPIEPYSGASES